MKKALIVLMIFTVVLSNMPTANAATDPYNHSELLEYEGYGKAMYETLVDETLFITGQYTNNKEYVSESIDVIRDYAKFWIDEFNEFDQNSTDLSSALRNMIEMGGGYALTVADWFKKMFMDYESENEDSDGTEIIDESNFTAYEQYLYYEDGFVHIKEGYTMKYTTYDGFTYSYNLFVPGLHMNAYNASYYFNINHGGTRTVITSPTIKKGAEANKRDREIFNSYSKSVAGYMARLHMMGVVLIISDADSEIKIPSVSPKKMRAINNYLKENTPQVAIPQPRPYLVCPNGTKIQMSISGSTFLSVDGTVMLVNKDGTAQIDGSICNLGWDKPIVKYEGDKTVIERPDGTFEDAETGDGGITDPGEGCDTVLCFLGGLTKGIADIVKAILGLVGKILDGLLGLFLPDNLDFMRAEFDKMQGSLNSKFGVLESVKGTITGGFAESDNKLNEIVLDLPILNEPVRFDTSFIESHIATLKRVMSGFMVLLTMLYLYRKITGRGGVMEK